MFKNIFSYQGRIRRMEYGISMIIYFFYALIISAVAEYAPLMYFVLLIPAIWFMTSQGAKRCHDLGRSGWFQLIPFYGLFMLFQDGDAGGNQWGGNPKGIGASGVLQADLRSETLDAHLK